MRPAGTSTNVLFWFIVFLTFSLFSANAQAQQQADGVGSASPAHLVTAPVRVDGQVIMHLRGVSAFPAKERAKLVRERLLALARNDALDPADINQSEDDGSIQIRINDELLFTLVQADADLEEVPLDVLADVTEERIRELVIKYREDRSPDALKVSALYFIGLTLALAGLLWLMSLLKRWARRKFDEHVAEGVRKLEQKSVGLLQGGQLWRLAQGLLNLVYITLYVIIGYFYLQSVLGSFPWTRGFALVLLELITGPLTSMLDGFLDALPNLVFLVILFFVVRYVLRLMHALFKSVEQGYVKFANFDPEWSMSTFRLLRLVVLAFSLVVAYPYIPGSDSAAFKGVSLFLGIVVSLGSTSFISNMIAGLTMTYRGAYRVGDWVKIGDEQGQVIEMRMMVMRLRTRKNEVVTLPNSVILNTNVTNYSSMGREEGVMLYTEVSIGYDTPWRKVESMLLEAASRVEGVLADPQPFVRQRKLGDFSVSYELNALTNQPERMPGLYSELHGHIQDVFNENGVQIMSPAYVADPVEPKLVPPDQKG